MLDFFNLFDLQLILTLLFDSFSLVSNAFSFSLGLLGAWFRINEVESAAEVGCVARTIHQCTGLGFLFRKVTQKY